MRLEVAGEVCVDRLIATAGRDRVTRGDEPGEPGRIGVLGGEGKRHHLFSSRSASIKSHELDPFPIVSV